ncbi:hypothetical protein Glove_95g68 [Diversispora epigaea]|uniref:Uncharacterized protein n=1 Tax=Diversispora epigaea TaxID=1348612 RepID=A0A397J9D4_9GLOM|nr:hypothetical protein Glove_95g68 [Diversispora epigaea]
MTKDRNIESGINKENDRDESAEGPNIDNQILEASSFSSRVFIHDYPKNLRIEAQYKSKGQTYISYYNITALGTYPITPKLTQKPNCNNVPQYPIPDNYIVETEIAERGVKCETKYVSNSKVNYTVAWKEGRAEWSVNSTKSASAVVNLFLKKINWKNSKLSGPRVFGFDIEPLHNIRIQMNPNSIITTKVNKQIRPFEDITSRSQQHKRLKSFGKNVKKTVDELIVKHKLTDSSEQSIIFPHYIEFEYKENQIQIKFKNLDSKIRLDAVVRVCDEALLGRDGYRHLAAVVPSLFREYLVADRRNEINKLINAQIPVEIFNIDQDVNQSNTNNYNSEIINDILVDNNEIGNGAFRSLATLLKILIPIWKKGENPVIIPGDTLYIKLEGDGRNVGRKQNHVMITFCLLNEGEEVLKPDKQYSICLYIGKETYEILDRVGKIFALQLMDLKQNGIIDEDGNHWPIEFFFSGDWKFLYIIMGLNAPNSNYFCLYCECDIKSRHNMNLSWPPTGNKKDNNEIGNGAFRSLVTLLKILIPIWKKGENPVIIPGDTLYIKLEGDGRNVGRKQNHVMITFCLLNEGEEVLKPDKQYSICLYIGKETYEILDRVGKIFALQLMDLKQNGIIDEDGNHWPIEFFFSGNKKSSIFPVIDLLNYIPDELHTLLRISDILIQRFI